jgi:hypothetical protein
LNPRHTAEKCDWSTTKIIKNRYVILVHGVTDSEWNSKERWKAWQQWMTEIGLNDEQKIMRYQYDVEKTDAQIYTSNGIELEAIRLLDSLLRCQQAENEETRGTKRFVFVMLDIGGIIVKKVLDAH